MTLNKNNTNKIKKLKLFNNEKNIKNFPKKPINGGIPANDKKIKQINNDNKLLLFNNDKSNNSLNSFKLYFLTFKIKKNNKATLNK